MSRRRLLRSALGATRAARRIVEFAMVLPVLCVLLLGIFDLGYRSYAASVVQGALHDAARMATVGGVTTDARSTRGSKPRLQQFRRRSATITIDDQLLRLRRRRAAGDDHQRYRADRQLQSGRLLRGRQRQQRLRPRPRPRRHGRRRRHRPLPGDDHLSAHRSRSAASSAGATTSTIAAEHGAAQPALCRRATSAGSASRCERDAHCRRRWPPRRFAARAARLRPAASPSSSSPSRCRSLLTLGLVGLETANFAMAHLRVSNIAMLTADNAARVRDSIDEADVIELFTGAKMTGDSIKFAPERPDHPVQPRANSRHGGAAPASGSAGSAATARSTVSLDAYGRAAATRRSRTTPTLQCCRRPARAARLAIIGERRGHAR